MGVGGGSRLPRPEGWLCVFGVLRSFSKRSSRGSSIDSIVQVRTKEGGEGAEVGRKVGAQGGVTPKELS